MTERDERIVSMRFENKNFENNVKQSLSTLDKLKEKLSFKGASKGFDAINAASKKVDLSHVESNFNKINESAKRVSLNPLSQGVEQVRLKFSALELAAVTVFTNIVNKAVNAGTHLANSLTVAPVKTGLQEYETQLNAVQTILANTQSKGSTLTDVNAALDELNTYADKTIYNFTEMTRNIGTFTAAGIDLDTSTSAIKGIANLAAISGSNSQQASTAMYQLSQALASGTVKLMDWNSVVNAGMGGQVFQDALKETARLAGVNIDEQIALKGSFRETLQSGWLTSEILTDTLDKFTGNLSEADLAAKGYTEEQIKNIMTLGQTANDAATKVKTFTQLMDTTKEAVQSGWAQTWRIIIGDFEEAKALWTGISTVINDAIGKSSDARNAILTGWKEAGGRTELIDGFSKGFEALLSVLKPIKDAFREIFPALTSEKLLKFTTQFKEFMSGLKIGEETASHIKNIFKGVFALINIGIEILKSFGRGFFELGKHVLGNSGSLLKLAGGIGGVISKINDALISSKALSNGISTVFSFLKSLVSIIFSLFNPVIDSVSLTKEEVDQLGESFKKVGNSIKVITGWFSSAFNIIASTLKNISSRVGETIKLLVSGLKEAFAIGDITRFTKALNGALIAGVLFKLNKFIKGFLENVSVFDKIDDFIGKITGILDSVRDSLKTWQMSIKSTILKNIAISVGILAVSLLILASIDPERLNRALAGMTMMFMNMFYAFRALSKINTNGIINGIGQMVLLIGMAISMTILAGALKKISSLDYEGIQKGLVGLIGVSLLMATVSKRISNVKPIKITAAVSLILLAVSIQQLSKAVIIFSAISWEGIAKGLIGVATILTTLSVFLNKTKLNLNIFIVSLGIVAISGALFVLEKVIQGFASISWTGLAKGLTGIGALLLELTIATNKMKIGAMMRASMSMYIMAISINALYKAVKDYSDMSWMNIAKGMTAIAAALTILVLSTRYLKDDELIKLTLTLPIIIEMLRQLASLYKELGALSWNSIAKGLSGMISSMIILWIYINKMKPDLRAAASLLIVAMAVKRIAMAVTLLSGISIVNAAVGIIGLLGVFKAIHIGIKLIGNKSATITKMALSIIVLSGSLTILAASVAAIGVSISIFLTSLIAGIAALSLIEFDKTLKALAVMGMAFVGIAVTAKLLKPLAGTIIKLSTSIFIFGVACLAVAAAIGILSTALSSLALIGKDSIGNIIETLKGLIIGFIKSLPEIISATKDAIISIVKSVIAVFVTCVPDLIRGFLDTLVDSMSIMTEYAPQLISLFSDLLIKVFDGLTEKIPQLTSSFMKFLGAFGKAISDNMSNADMESILLGTKAIAAVGGLIILLNRIKTMIPGAMVGLAQSMVFIAELGAFLAAAGAINQIPGLKWLIDEGGDLLESVGVAIGKFFGGIAGGILKGISSQFSAIATDLSNFMTNLQPFLDGASKINPGVASGVWALTKSILLLTASNVLDGISRWFTGGRSISKFSEELVPFGKSLAKFADATKTVDGDAIKNAANAGKIITEMADSIPNSGGIIGIFAGNNNMDKFGEQLSLFGKALNDFANNTKDVDATVVKKAASAGKAMSSLQSTIPKSGGFVEIFTGSHDFRKFSLGIGAFGKGLKGFYDSAKEVNADSVSKLAEAGASLAKLNDALPKTGGILDVFTGNHDFAKFSIGIAAFGKGLKAFYDSAKGMNVSEVNGAIDIGSRLVDISRDTTAIGGMLSIFSGSTDLGTFGSTLKNFGQGIADFCSATASMTYGTLVTSALDVAKQLIEFSKDTVAIDSLFEWATGDKDLGTFGSKLKSFGEGIADFCSATASMTYGTLVTSALDVAKQLIEFSKDTVAIDSLFEWATGSKDLATFGATLKSFGQGIADFCSSTINIPYGTLVTSALNVAKQLVEFSKNTESINSFFKWATGAKDLETFGATLKNFGQGISDFCSATVSMPYGTLVTSALNVAKQLIDFSKNTESINSFFEWATGDKDLETFGATLKNFGQGIADFCSATVSMTYGTLVTSALDVARQLIEFSKDTTGIKSFFEWATGSKDLETFGATLTGFGEGIAGFCSATASMTYGTLVTSALDVARQLIELSSSITSNMTDKPFTYFGDDIKTFGDKFSEFTTVINGIDLTLMPFAIHQIVKLTEMANSIASVDTGAINAMADALKNLGDTGVEKIVQAFIGAKDRVVAATETMFNYIVDSINVASPNIVSKFETVIGDSVTKIEEQYNAFYNAGITLVGKLKSGIDNSTFGIAGKFTVPIATALSSLSLYYISFYNAGSYLVDGFANGISANTWKASATATVMANAAVTAAQKALDEHSPSRVSYKIGDFFGIGFTNAIEDSGSKAYASSYDMASMAKDGLNKAIDTAYSIFSTDVDMTPTISPVIDLTNVNRGVSLINGNLSGLGTTITAAHTLSGKLNQNGGNNSLNISVDNSNVVSELTALRNDINGLNKAMSKMQIVMDTGRLVGALTKPMDNELGRRAIYAGRGM